MYTLEKLNSVTEQLSHFPEEKDISLKLYCEYYDYYIRDCTYIVELLGGEKLTIQIKAGSIAHIMDIHAFYDSTIKDKKLRYSGSFSNVDAYRNMKKSIITLDTLKKSKQGREWKKNTVRDRVLGFPFIRTAILKGEWYKFDINKFNGKTNVIPEYIAVMKIGKIYFNFCFEKKGSDTYYCISDIVVYKSNSRVENQELLNVERVTELKNDKINRVVCRSKHMEKCFRNKNGTVISTINCRVHEKIYKQSKSFNSILIEENSYRIEYSKIDNFISRKIR